MTRHRKSAQRLLVERISSYFPVSQIRPQFLELFVAEFPGMIDLRVPLVKELELRTDDFNDTSMLGGGSRMIWVGPQVRIRLTQATKLN